MMDIVPLIALLAHITLELNAGNVLTIADLVLAQLVANHASMATISSLVHADLSAQPEHSLLAMFVLPAKSLVQLALTMLLPATLAFKDIFFTTINVYLIAHKISSTMVKHVRLAAQTAQIV